MRWDGSVIIGARLQTGQPENGLLIHRGCKNSTHPPIQWVEGMFFHGWNIQGVKLIIHLHIVAKVYNMWVSPHSHAQ